MFRGVMFIVFCVFSLSAKPVVVVSILPQQYVVEKIAGDSIDVFMMVETTANHETYEPKPKQMRLLAKADIYFAIGLPFENIWLERFKSASKMQIVNVDKGIEKIELSGHSHKHEEHGHKEEHHDAKESDPHIWLDPILLKTQAKTVKNAFADKYPENAALFEKNYENFEKEMDALNADISKILERIKNRSFFVFHPSWGYFAARYNLEQIYVEVEGKEAKGAELVKTLKIAKGKNIKALLVEPQVSQKAAKAVADEIGVKLINVDPMKKNIAKNLINFAKTLADM